MENEAELLYLEVGGVPFRCRAYPSCVSPTPGYEFVLLLENVGDANVITNDPATTFYRSGELMVVSWDGTRHPTDDRRVVQMAGEDYYRQRGLIK
jgi:hypothetical protein